MPTVTYMEKTVFNKPFSYDLNNGWVQFQFSQIHWVTTQFNFSIGLFSMTIRPLEDDLKII